jgi:hypothetical protein
MASSFAKPEWWVMFLFWVHASGVASRHATKKRQTAFFTGGYSSGALVAEVVAMM